MSLIIESPTGPVGGPAREPPPRVSVAMLTHNHGSFIATALDSILEQVVDFDYEIVIGDDGSADETVAIVEQYAERHAGMIRLLRSENRRGVFENVLQTLAACRGDFIALLEGDDAWTCKDKLSYQIDFLQQNPDYVGCFHDARIHSDALTSIRHADLPKTKCRHYSDFNVYPSDFCPWDLLARNVIPTASLVYRNVIPLADFEQFRDIPFSLSWLLELLVIRRSKFRYFDEVWAVHNNHSLGVTKRYPRSDFTRANLRILRRLRHDDCYRLQKAHLYRCEVKELYFLFDQELEQESTLRLLTTMLQMVVANTMYSIQEARAMLKKIRARRYSK